jgi:hypothetical protein
MHAFTRCECYSRAQRENEHPCCRASPKSFDTIEVEVHGTLSRLTRGSRAPLKVTLPFSIPKRKHRAVPLISVPVLGTTRFTVSCSFGFLAQMVCIAEVNIRGNSLGVFPCSSNAFEPSSSSHSTGGDPGRGAWIASVADKLSAGIAASIRTMSDGMNMEVPLCKFLRTRHPSEVPKDRVDDETMARCDTIYGGVSQLVTVSTCTPAVPLRSAIRRHQPTQNA